MDGLVKSFPGGVSDNFRIQAVFRPVRQETRLSEAIAEFTSFSAGRKTAPKMSALAGGETFYGVIISKHNLNFYESIKREGSRTKRPDNTTMSGNHGQIQGAAPVSARLGLSERMRHPRHHSRPGPGYRLIRRNCSARCRQAVRSFSGWKRTNSPMARCTPMKSIRKS